MTAIADAVQLDEAKLDEFVGRFVQDLGAVAHAATVLVGDRLGLYEAMADGAWLTPRELADRAQVEERQLAEWLAAQVASRYIEHDDTTGRFRLPAEHAFALVSDENAVFVPAGFQVGAAMMRDLDAIATGFRTGAGMPWSAHDDELFVGTERFFRPGYLTNLTSSWIPSIDGLERKLESGALVADVGCGHGASTAIMAAAYPESRFVGIDPHPASIEAARRQAATSGVADRCTFEVATAHEFDGRGFDLVAMFDSLHDMGDPVGALRHIRSTLADGGVVMLVEPNAGDRLDDNVTPIGRTFYSASALLCVPNATAQGGGTALGAQAGEAGLREVAERAGFTTVRRSAETPFNMVLELRE